MFVELMPVLANRTVIITVSKAGDNTLQVNVVPRKVTDDENAALTTPLSYLGSPEELDAELGHHLTSYSEAHKHLGSTLDTVKAEIAQAEKDAKAEADRKKKELADKNKGKPTAKPEPPKAPGLFDGVADLATAPTAATPVAAQPTAAAADSDESDEEEKN